MPTRELVLDQARKAEKLGYHSVWVFDHVVTRHRFLDPIVALSMIAGVTSRVKLGTAILILPARNPLILAKEIASLDYLSEGRVILGVGTGSAPDMHHVWSKSLRERREKMIESIELLRRIWMNPSATYEGVQYKYKDVMIEPKPIQKDVPILMGGHSEASIRRAARYADGYIGGNDYTPELLKETREKIFKHMKEFGRKTENFIFAAELWSHVGSSETEVRNASEGFLAKYFGQSYDEAKKHGCILGTPEQCVEQIKLYRDAGLDLLIIATTTLDISQGELYAREIMPHFAK